MRITLKNISQAAKVSVSTVSDILNRRPVSYSEDLRKRVFEVAEQMNYRPNAMARGLRRQQTELLGLVIPNRRYSFFADIAISVEKFLRRRGCQAITVFCDDDVTPEGSMAKELEVLHARQVDGIILNPCKQNPFTVALFNRFIRQGTPLVFFDQDIEGVDAPFVGTDDIWSSREAVRYLIGRGHRHIAHLGGGPDSVSSLRRMEGYKMALEEAGIAFDPGLVFGQNYDTAAETLRSFFAMSPRPTAVFCANDILAGEFYTECFDRGVKIPQDVSVVGFGNLMISEYMCPKLTTMNQSADELADQVVRAMFERIESLAAQRRLEAPTKSYIKANLIERGSVSVRSHF